MRQTLIGLVFVSLVAFLPGCDVLMSLFGTQESGEGTQVSCEMAEVCCVELMEATAYTEVAERAEQRGWPNHCPSWNARSEQECSGFLDAVEVQMKTLQHDHPVFEPQRCTR